MAGSRTLGWKHPSLTPRSAACLQDRQHSVAHRNHSPPFLSLAVRHEDDLVVPINAFDAYAVEFSLVSHSRIACENCDLTEKELLFDRPFASLNELLGGRQKLPFCLVVKSQSPTVFLH